MSGFCVDSVCCNGPCEGVCTTCNNAEGDCSSLPKYAQDDAPVCSGVNVCDGFGGCLLRPGEICSSDVECASYRCEKSRCVKLSGEPCNSPLDCVDNGCMNGVCMQ
ncbi:hypothetical protein [Polyangium mundeleinium]|uniref:Disintegrin domain-containing protein n=1 Tax=Polyangium mundeleinium TaxID=2995306 RepID=A0ABT5F577_9BACT|nr:hypothetical protein [Polyangium mundeleinium]MDC0748302.1 hypothetical protein [Polyangium mundeleinium]